MAYISQNHWKILYLSLRQIKNWDNSIKILGTCGYKSVPPCSTPNVILGLVYNICTPLEC